MNELMDYFNRGGALMWVLLGCSVVGVAIILERSLAYVIYGLRPDPWLEKVLTDLREGNQAAAADRARACRHPVARIVEVYLSNLDRPARIRLENIKRTGSLLLEQVEKRLRVLAAIAHIAPLIGLLGTVVGMVVAFAQIQTLEGAARPADLAGGIWEALLTTVFGLAIAIPCMAAFHAFESHTDKISRRMELAVTALDDVMNSSGKLSDGSEVPESGVENAATDERNWTSVG